MLRRARIIVSVLFFAAVTLLFLDFTSATHAWLDWTAKVQFIPALLAANFAVVGALVLLTLLFGRIYCSVICPLGIMQDIFSHIAGRKKRNRFSYTPSKTKTRIAFLTLFIALSLLGFLSFAAIIAPYSMYGRIASNIFYPIFAAANNVLAFLAEKLDSYAFYSVDVWVKGAGAFAVALASFLVVGILAWRGGRTYCNTVCPVGTVLGFIAKFSLFRPVIDLSKCNSCRLCERNCKAKCISSKEHKIDYSRCVACFDCLDKCRSSAISYSFALGGKFAKGNHAQCLNRKPVKRELKSEKNIDNSNKPKTSVDRRAFLSSAMVLATGTASENMKLDGGLAPIKPRHSPKRKTRIVPPGALSIANLSDKCTACHLCVSACPSHVLEPLANLENFLQPQMSYEHGYCRVECVECSKVCPSGAILPITKAEKTSIQIGRAVWSSDLCIVNTDSQQCDNCFRQCPTGAIQMVSKDPKDSSGLKIPIIDEYRCIGCGACENLCPARPVSAIHVEGYSVHNKI